MSASKAFLSYSSVDSAFTRVVAQRLGRARVTFDQFSFKPGMDFRQAIRKGLDESRLFVLFASKASLTSTWVRYEFGEAEIGIIGADLLARWWSSLVRM
jgi:hypothetical protein